MWTVSCQGISGGICTLSMFAHWISYMQQDRSLWKSFFLLWFLQTYSTFTCNTSLLSDAWIRLLICFHFKILSHSKLTGITSKAGEPWLQCQPVANSQPWGLKTTSLFLPWSYRRISFMGTYPTFNLTLCFLYPRPQHWCQLRWLSVPHTVLC